MTSQDLEAKIVVLGSSGVGKTCLLTRFMHNKFLPPSASQPTVGATFTTKRLLSPDTHPPTTIRMQLWDTAGQERFRSISKLYYRGAHAAVLCYDITDEASFLDMATWMEELRDVCGDECIIHVVGTKADIVAEDPRSRMVPFERCIQYLAAQLHGQGHGHGQGQGQGQEGSVSSRTVRSRGLSSAAMDQAKNGGSPGPARNSGEWDADVVWDSCHEISAKDGDGVEEVFRVITRRLVEQRGLTQSRETSLQDGMVAGDGESGRDSFDRRLDKRTSFRLGGLGDRGMSLLGLANSAGGSVTGAADSPDEPLRGSGRCC